METYNLIFLQADIYGYLHIAQAMESIVERGGCMLKIGDKVSHPSFGGCVISDIREQKVDSGTCQYLVLTLSNESNMQILIPAEKTDKIGIRAIISEKFADQLLDSFTSLHEEKGRQSNIDKHRRAYVEIIKKGTLHDLVALIQELTLHGKLSSCDKELLPIAQRKLYSEISLAKDWDFQRVLQYALMRMKPDVSLTEGVV